MVRDQTDSTVDAAMRRALTAYLPDSEPPIGVQVDEVLRLARRRYLVRRLTHSAVAAVITVLALAIPFALTPLSPDPALNPGSGGPSTQPATPTTRPDAEPPTAVLPPEIATILVPPPNTGTPTGSASPGAPAEQQPTAQQQAEEPQPELRLPPGHTRDEGADALADFTVQNRLPPGTISSHFGTLSQPKESKGYGFHFLWRDGDRYGYLILLHRFTGMFPATDYGLPVEPCAGPDNRLAAYNCVPAAAPEGDTATAFEVSQDGYRMRGLVWDKHNNIRVTAIFYLPAAGAWTPFPVLDSQPRLTSFPVGVEDLARLSGMPG